jgi:hypothetical protein
MPDFAPDIPAASDPYLAVAAAQQIAASLFGVEAWDAAADADRERALREATLRVDALNYQGRKHVPAQARQFPRVPYPHDRPELLWDSGGDGIATVPHAVLVAVVAEADALLAGAAAHRAALAEGRAVASESAGPRSQSFVPPMGANGRPQLCERATVLLRPYRLTSGRLA